MRHHTVVAVETKTLTAPYDVDYVATYIFRHTKALHAAVPKVTELCYVLDVDCVFVRVKTQYIAALDQLLEIDLHTLWKRTVNVEPVDPHEQAHSVNKMAEYRIQLASARSPKIAEIYDEIFAQQTFYQHPVVPNTRVIGVCLAEYLKRHLLLERAVLSY